MASAQAAGEKRARELTAAAALAAATAAAELAESKTALEAALVPRKAGPGLHSTCRQSPWQMQAVSPGGGRLTSGSPPHQQGRHSMRV